MKKRLIIVASLILIWSGCAVKGPAFQQVTEIPPGTGVVYFYRPYSFADAQQPNPTIYEDQENYVIESGPGGYYPHIISQGTYLYTARKPEIMRILGYFDLSKLLSSDTKKNEVLLTVKAGKSYYIKVIALGVDGSFDQPHPHLTLVDKTVGMKEIQDCKLQD